MNILKYKWFYSHKYKFVKHAFDLTWKLQLCNSDGLFKGSTEMYSCLLEVVWILKGLELHFTHP